MIGFGLALLGVARNDVVDRVRDLREPPRRRMGLCVMVVAAAVLCWASVTTAMPCAHHVVELAEAAAGRG